MRNIKGMTVEQHHLLCIGVLAMCYKHVPDGLKQAIQEACESAKQMGMDIDPGKLKTEQPICSHIGLN